MHIRCTALIPCAGYETSLENGVTLHSLIDSFTYSGDIAEGPKNTNIPFFMYTKWERPDTKTSEVIKFVLNVYDPHQKLSQTFSEQIDFTETHMFTEQFTEFPFGLVWSEPGVYTMKIESPTGEVYNSRSFIVGAQGPQNYSF